VNCTGWPTTGEAGTYEKDAVIAGGGSCGCFRAHEKRKNGKIIKTGNNFFMLSTLVL
jgi:hypothetical protein